MKDDLTIAILQHYQELSPEVIRAQRMAELADIAEHRRRRMEQIEAWAVPEKRAKRQAEAAADLEAAKEIAATMDHKEQPSRPFWSHVKISPLVKAAPRSRWQRILDWLA